MTAEFILEVGTEEIPSGYMTHALKALKDLAVKALQDNRIEVTEDLLCYGTPPSFIL